MQAPSVAEQASYCSLCPLVHVFWSRWQKSPNALLDEYWLALCAGGAATLGMRVSWRQHAAQQQAAQRLAAARQAAELQRPAAQQAAAQQVLQQAARQAAAQQRSAAASPAVAPQLAAAQPGVQTPPRGTAAERTPPPTPPWALHAAPEVCSDLVLVHQLPYRLDLRGASCEVYTRSIHEVYINCDQVDHILK